MHKITKGIKKKIKSKKGNKGDDLFDPAELEKYRKEKEQREAEAEAEGGPEQEQEGPKDEEWQRFQALTAGVDSILKKSQGDLDRIKSTSYFQRKPPGGAKPAAAAESKESASKAPAVKAKRWVGFEEGAAVEESPEEEQEVVKEEEVKEEVQEEEKPPEEEEEEEEEDLGEDIFDTSYVDVVASGEVKLAYIPESPTAEGPEEDGFDPFDTSIAEKVIGPEEEPPKGKKKQLVSLGCAVEVLTGRIDRTQVLPITTQASKKRRVTRRPEDVDLFILDDDAEVEKEANLPGSEAHSRRASGVSVDPFGALDEDGIPDTTPIGEALSIAPLVKEEQEAEEKEVVLKDLVAEFDIIDKVEPITAKVEEDVFGIKPLSEKEPEEEEEDEFAALAAESAKKTTPKTIALEEEAEEEDDPFDTTAAAGVLGELTSAAHVPPTRPPRPVSSPDVDVLLGGEKEEDFGWEEFDQNRSGGLPPLRPAPPSSGPPPRPAPARPPPITHADGEFVPSLGQPPLTFTETAIDAISRDLDSRLEENEDPFDTSFAEVVSAPGRAELRLIESEILGEAEDEDFDPRAEEAKQEVLSSVKIHISLPAGEEGAEQEIGGIEVDSEDLFDTSKGQDEGFSSSLQLSHRDLLGGSTTDLSKLGHDPISPDEASEEKEEFADYVDPFDTSIVDPKIAPGKAELKIIEKELLGEEETVTNLQRSLSDPDFDPRGEEAAPNEQNVEASRPDLLEAENDREAKESIVSPSARPDLLSVGEDIEAEFSKPLTPLVEEGERVAEAELRTDGVDPFDTTFAENILPGKAELRIIESELFGGPDITSGITRSLSDPDFDPRESSSEEQKESSTRRRFSDASAFGVVQRVPQVAHPTSLPLQNIANPAPKQPDLLAVEEEAESAVKPLSPARENAEEEDPFDTSTVSVEVLKPGKAELKILESELIGGKAEEQEVPTTLASVTARVQALVDPQFRSAQPTVLKEPVPSPPEIKPPDLLNLPESEEVSSGAKLLTPLVENASFPEGEDFDPFDTSIAEGIGPGRTELKLLESELIGQ